jgi:AcrR family transcriptional regulator
VAGSRGGRARAAAAGFSRGRGEIRDVLRSQVVEIQRSRLLAAAVATVAELGYERTTVAHITARAGVSRRTFYELYANREECITGVLQGTAGELQGELEAQELSGLAWRERMRRGLWTVLCFLDREPALARAVVVDMQHGRGSVLVAREAVLRRLVALVDEGRGERAASGCSELTAEGVLGATVAIVYRALARPDRAAGKARREPLSSLFPELLGIVLLPYLGHAATRREQARPAPALPPARPVTGQRPLLVGEDPLAGLQMRVTYRTARVLQGIAERPGASNREVADYAGIHDQGQVSKLLGRLERLGLTANRGAGHVKGEPNAWSLTVLGEQVAQRVSPSTNLDGNPG